MNQTVIQFEKDKKAKAEFRKWVTYLKTKTKFSRVDPTTKNAEDLFEEWMVDAIWSVTNDDDRFEEFSIQVKKGPIGNNANNAEDSFRDCLMKKIYYTALPLNMLDLVKEDAIEYITGSLWYTYFECHPLPYEEIVRIVETAFCKVTNQIPILAEPTSDWLV
jgi:hypothetical protein